MISMIRARIATPWTQTQERDAGGTLRAHYLPGVRHDYDLAECVDVTSQGVAQVLPDPNSYTVEVLCTQAVYDQIAADDTYVILWSEEA